jgi:hypothetical protein
MSLTKNISLTQGLTFTDTIQHLDDNRNPISLVGSVIYGQIQRSTGGNVIVAFTSTITDIGNSVIQYGLTSGVTANIDMGRYVYYIVRYIHYVSC